jgi:hypothetical protein
LFYALTKHPGWSDHTQAIYSLDEIKEKATEVIKLPSGGWLALYKQDDGHEWYHYGLFQFAGAESDGDKNTMVEKIFIGQGPSGNLREMRHTYFGEKDGYIFYLPMKMIREAFDVLSKYYDET